MRLIAGEMRRQGLLLAREGIELNGKKLLRLDREEKLMVRRRDGCKRALGTRAPILPPQAVNQRWSLDCVLDAFADGGRFRIVTVVDDYSRAMLRWSQDRQVEWHYIAPGKPTQNAFVESF